MFFLMCDNHIDVFWMFSKRTNDEDSKAESSQESSLPLGAPSSLYNDNVDGFIGNIKLEWTVDSFLFYHRHFFKYLLGNTFDKMHA